MKKLSVILLAAALLSVAQASFASRNGEKVYKKSCKMCHNTGMLGAPKRTDKAAWKARRAHYDEQTMVEHTLKGFGKMRAKGGCKQCTDEEITAAVEYMLHGD